MVIVLASRMSVRIALLLGVTQTIGYGTLYYAFGVLAPFMAVDLDYSLTWIYAFFSIGLLAGGLVSPAAGRALDMFNPGLFMAAGSLASAVALAVWALAPGQLAFGVSAILVLTASVMVLYEAAFVLAAKAAPGAARRTITGITLIAGFASTIFWPLTDWLSEDWSWREIYLLYAALHVAICMPLHLALVRTPQPGGDGAEEAAGPAAGGVLAAGVRNRALSILIFSFSATTFVVAAVHLHLIGLLTALGLGGSAALVAALIGPAQVAGRLAEFSAGERFDIVHVSVFAAAALPAGIAALLLGAPALMAAVAFAVVFGIGQGLSYIVRGVLPLHLFGHRGYGALSGKINSARLVVSAAAPFVTAAIFETGGAYWALAALGVIGLAAALALLALPALMRRA